MFRQRSSGIGITPADLEIVDNMLARLNSEINTVSDPPSTPARPPLRPFSPIHLGPIDSINMTAAPVMSTPAPLAQPDHTNLPYGPEREAMLVTNLHISHFESMNEQTNAQSAASDALIAQLTASYENTIAQLSATQQNTIAHLSANHLFAINQLIAEVNDNRFTLNIYNWRHGVTNQEADLNQATDLSTKYADLRSAPLSTLAGVKAAEAADEPGRKTGMKPSISTILGIEGQGSGGGGASAGQLYGDQEDVAAFLGVDVGEAGAEDARSGTTGVTAEEEKGEGAGDGSVGRATALGADGDLGGEEMGEGDGAVQADAGGAAVVKAKPRHRLLGKLKRFFRI